MSIKKSVKDEVESVLIAISAKIDSLKAQVDKLCESTGACEAPTKKQKGPVEKK
jgi:hypothetical protein